MKNILKEGDSNQTFHFTLPSIIQETVEVSLLPKVHFEDKKANIAYDELIYKFKKWNVCENSSKNEH
jgi:hypothetical protein